MEVPAPKVSSGKILIQTTHSLVSLGTERMLVDFGKASYINKARQQPEKVKMVLDKVKTDGLKPTLDAVKNKLDQPLPMGYCNVGRVIEVGPNVAGFSVGDRVISNGHHAEIVSVPQNLVAKIPDNVTDEDAAFTVIGAIALQGVRLLDPSFGETIVVVGLGLIGLITCQILQANGCNVIGYDFDEDKVNRAKAYGVTGFNPGEGLNPVSFVLDITDGIGADGIMITASAKKDSIVHDATNMSRKRGRIILVGVVDLKLNRSDFYEKELSFQVSCSYGPGRYDPFYEEKGQDYPIGFVRWTENRNFQAFLNALSKKKIDVNSLITEKVPLDKFDEIYGDMNKKGSIASILEYPESIETKNVIRHAAHSFKRSNGVIGIIGAGNFTGSTILPIINRINADVKTIASSGGLSANTLAKKWNISQSTTDHATIMNDEDIDSVIITTRHNLHASMVIESLKSGKHVFVEKPLCLTLDELEEIDQHITSGNSQILVGFNRRFSPYSIKLNSMIGENTVNIVATFNAGAIPQDSWIHDMDIGGGRIIGEACHFIDLCSFLTGSIVTQVCMNAMGTDAQQNTDNASILLKYKNGSNAVINYFANGSKSYPKERVEVFSRGATFVIDNWRSLTGYGVPGFKKMKGSQDKGHVNQFRLFVETIQTGGDEIISWSSITNTTRASILALDSLQKNTWVDV